MGLLDVYGVRYSAFHTFSLEFHFNTNFVSDSFISELFISSGIHYKAHDA